MAYVKFQINRCKIDGEIAENDAILVYLTASSFFERKKCINRVKSEVILTDIQIIILFE